MKKANERLYGVVGLGIFGSTVAKTLSQNNCEVIAVDGDMKCVNRMADIVTEAMQCDVTHVSQLRVAGLADCDIVFVCMGSHLEESALAIINLKELGVPYIIAKAKNKRFMQVFSELGADKVVRPEKEMGEQVAKSVLGNNIIEIIDFDKNYSIVEIPTPEKWIGKTLMELELRKRYEINVIAIRSVGQEQLNISPEPDYALRRNDHLFVVANANKLDRFDSL